MAAMKATCSQPMVERRQKGHRIRNPRNVQAQVGQYFFIFPRPLMSFAAPAGSVPQCIGADVYLHPYTMVAAIHSSARDAVSSAGGRSLSLSRVGIG